MEGERRGSELERVRLSILQNPTGDHLLGVIGLHVAVVLADTLRFPLLSRLLSVKWICVIFEDDHLKKKRDSDGFSMNDDRL